MSLSLCVLASGSSGNSTVLRAPRGSVLIDAGIGPRTTASRLADAGAALADVRAIVLTHLDRDHFSPTWMRTLLTRGLSVFCHANRARELRHTLPELADLVRPFRDEAFEPAQGVVLTPLPLAHDVTGSHGFRIECGAARIGYATDLGRVPPRLIEMFVGLGILAIESNYDPEMQRTSGRPWFLQRRITGGRGHLSNEQALAAVRAIFDQHDRAGHDLPRHVVLLHRSRDCNCPRLVRELFASDRRIAPRLTLAEQFERTGWFDADVGSAEREPRLSRQLALFA